VAVGGDFLAEVPATDLVSVLLLATGITMVDPAQGSVYVKDHGAMEATTVHGTRTLWRDMCTDGTATKEPTTITRTVIESQLSVTMSMIT